MTVLEIEGQGDDTLLSFDVNEVGRVRVKIGVRRYGRYPEMKRYMECVKHARVAGKPFNPNI